MDKHTPGPWKFDRALGCKAIKGGKSGTHQQAQYTEIAYTVGLADEDADEANARLMTAAPDLLSIARRWAALDGGAWNVERHATEKAELIAATQAVIVKATGASA